ncbi:hypothetical protein HSBAA_30490 [Vreelandella sulfidaeris]|uniref:DUF7352 domain-containing protein n=1 Tax=Vreelandella sulfidaeris TaxID=115553 RepID=A0A455U930_9GAMM|nr:hypothetical protein HSBAA_30490 [Halomonas sulfidaeris]
MPSTIHKFSMTAEQSEFQIPADATVLHVGHQHGVTCLWIQLDLEAPAVTRRFRIYATGQLITEPNDKLTYLGSVQTPAGFVWHLL